MKSNQIQSFGTKWMVNKLPARTSLRLLSAVLRQIGPAFYAIKGDGDVSAQALGGWLMQLDPDVMEDLLLQIFGGTLKITKTGSGPVQDPVDDLDMFDDLPQMFEVAAFSLKEQFSSFLELASVKTLVSVAREEAAKKMALIPTSEPTKS